MMSAIDLGEEEVRRRTVLWLRGTGINAWHYYGFLQQFTLEQLNQFKRIVCVSGGAAVLWVYVLSLGRHFDEGIVDHYDEILRRVLNQRGILYRMGRILSFRSPYLASQQLALLAELVSKESFAWTLSQFPLKNLRVLVATGNADYREFGESDADGTLQVASLIAIGGTPSTGQNLQVVDVDADCFDFEYASSSCRRAYQSELIARFPDDRKIILNTEMQRLDGRGNCSYLRCSPDKHPALMRALDSIRLFLNLPSGRYRQVFRWSCARR